MVDAASKSPKKIERQLNKPLLIYDGDCGFCIFWIDSWKQAIGDRLDFVTSQEAAPSYPEIPATQFINSVVLIENDGSVCYAAEAVFRALAYNPWQAWPLTLYKMLPGFASISEMLYRLVASNRMFFSKITFLLWGRSYKPPTFFIARWLFLRIIGIVYLAAFLSFGVQVKGLIGVNGILPATYLLQSVAAGAGAERYWLIPSLAWINSSDAFLQFLCFGGAALSAIAIVGIATAPMLALCWLFYLSLVTVGGDFMSFQWDALLLETGFLAIFFAPWQWLEPPWKQAKGFLSQKPPPTAFLWLLRFLLFRLVFSSGMVKLLSGDHTWRDLTALTYHFETQPLPTPIAWYVQQLPVSALKVICAATLSIEVLAPFLIFAPRRIRFAGGVILIALQILIELTGNYTGFNLLAIAMCLLLFDDAFFRKLIPKLPKIELATTNTNSWRKLLVIPLVTILLLGALTQQALTLGAAGYVPYGLRFAFGLLSPFEIVNGYGVFAVMTTARNEIIVQGSDDGITWKTYEFRYKPGDIHRAPPWVAPHQPRLDWQMWFASLETYQDNVWFRSFMMRLLQGSKDVLALLETNPFPDKPPKFVRGQFYQYHFTTISDKAQNGNWWTREDRGIYFPPAAVYVHSREGL
jgi:predicted DCC family thiol-disulfide oxidoreductase YuxK